jgi:AraC family transcriptional regulator
MGNPDFTPPPHRAISPSQWYAGMSGATVQGMVPGTSRSWMCRYANTNPEIIQPSLSEHVVAIHLAGPKRVRHWQAGRMTVHDVEENSITVMPAFSAGRWLTEGPIDYAHLTLSLGLLGQLAREELDRDPREILLRDVVGLEDKLVSQLLLALLEQIGAGSTSRLYQECLITTLAIGLLRRSSPSFAESNAEWPTRPIPVRGGLAGWQLRRVLDFMAENIAAEVGITDFVELTGLSRAQFFRAFKHSTGVSPHRYIMNMRIDRAKALLLVADATVQEVAASVGFNRMQHFAGCFRRVAGVSPHSYRLSMRQA